MVRTAVAREFVGEAGSQGRIISDHGTRADRDGVHPVAQLVDDQPRLLSGDPAAVPGARRDPAVEGHRVLGEDERPAGPDAGEETRVEIGCFARLQTNLDHDARPAQQGDPAAVYQWERIGDGSNAAGNAGGDDRLGAGRGSAVVAARLEGHVERRP